MSDGLSWAYEQRKSEQRCEIGEKFKATLSQDVETLGEQIEDVVYALKYIESNESLSKKGWNCFSKIQKFFRV